MDIPQTVKGAGRPEMPPRFDALHLDPAASGFTRAAGTGRSSRGGKSLTSETDADAAAAADLDALLQRLGLEESQPCPNLRDTTSDAERALLGWLLLGRLAGPDGPSGQGQLLQSLVDEAVGRFGQRVLLLCDNLSATHALNKGRATDGALLGLCRRSCAIQLATRMRVRWRYVESHRNPADGPSRAPDLL